MSEMVVVPREPTEEMLQGACAHHTPGVPMAEGRGECPRFETRRRIWAKMIDAAPASPPVGELWERVADAVLSAMRQYRSIGADMVAGHRDYIVTDAVKTILALLSQPGEGEG